MKTRDAALASSLTKKKKGMKNWTLFWMTVPFMVLVVLFSYIPLAGWYLAFIDFRPGRSIFNCEWVGLKFFKLILEDANIPNVVRNTLTFSAIWLVFSWMPMTFAILLNEIQKTRFRKFAQTATTLPNFISWVIIYSMMYAIFSTDGVLNLIITKLGGTGDTNILAENSIVYWVQYAIAQWKGLGWSAIIYIAAISGIDQEQYEAAVIDGAGRFRSAIHITLPSILPTYVVLLLMDISNLLNTGYEQYFLFKNPMVADKIEVLDLYVYRMGLQLADYSYATAVGIMKTILSITLLFIANTVAKKIRGTSII